MKKLFKKLLIILFIVFTVLFAYNLFRALTSGKQSLEISTSREIFSDGNIEAIISVRNKKTEQAIKSNLTVELKNNRNKTIKNCKQTIQIEEGDKANISMPLPENIKPGNYSLKITSKSGLKKDIEKVNVSITDKASTNIVISLDKGIYKPGDEVDFRALLISRKDDTPKKEDVEISIYDGNGNRVYIDKTKTSEFGIVSGKFVLANEVNSGEYKITVSTKTSTLSKTFNVNPYVAPVFEVNLSTEQDTYKVGDTAKIITSARYFFGEPVANATIKATINNKEFTGLTNSEGIYEYNYDLEENGKYNISVQVVDSSNYLIEQTKTIYATNSNFEVEIIPEYGNLIKGVDNKIYILTKKVDGTPIKTHCEFQIASIHRQIVTDETGIGSITINADDIGNLDYKTTLVVNASDMNGEQSYSSYNATVESYSGTVVGLDKLIYKQDEPITLSLNSATDVTNKEVFIYKNKELLKVISTDDDEVTFNLENTYGLIDIYTKNNLGRIFSWDLDYAYRYSSYSKRTIFISPNKALNINVTTDKEEYTPGSKLKLSLETKDETGKIADTGILVSILDEAILSLADNDLSIDNIKIALEDIELSNGITLADLYAEILEGTSDSKLRVALLKQDTKTPNILNVKTSYYDEARAFYIMKSVLFGLLSALFIFIYVSQKHSKLNTAFAGLINLIVVFCIVFTALYEFLYYTVDLSQISVGIICGIVSVILYALVLYKYNNWIFGGILDLIVLPGILAVVLSIINEITYNEFITIICGFLPVIIMTLLIVMSRKIKLNKFFEHIKVLSTKLTISVIIYVLAMLMASMFNFDAPFGVIVIILVLYWLSQKIYKKEDLTSNTVKVEISTRTIIFATAGLVLFAIFFIFATSSTFSKDVLDITDQDLYFNAEINSLDSVPQFSTTTKGDASFDAFESAVDSFTGMLSSSESKREEAILESSVGEEQTEKTVENIRNVFLESLAFIPEVITENGKAEVDIDISDNITTWNIQLVGNTKDGRLGYNSSAFRVFKEFFVDFSLPTNSVVSDKISIPVTLYNYTNNDLNIKLDVKENSSISIGNYPNTVTVSANTTKMIYIPIELLEQGKQTLRIDAEANGVSDIIEKSLNVTPNGIKKAKVVSSGSIEKKLELDHFTTESAIENTRKLKLKIYPSIISQTVEGMENIFRMPTGCFEQTSSSLYPNILALKYLEDTGLEDAEVKEKALDYISKGYQRILTFETSTKGGYSLYGNNPPETVLTAFGLMELNDLKDVYEIEYSVTEDMIDYLFSEQSMNGTFKYDSTYIGSASSTTDLAMNSYIIWALSEVCPNDERLDASIKYLENHLEKAEDNYTIALMANVFSNTKSKSLKNALNKLLDNVEEDKDGGAYISSKIRDYWGSYGRYQNIQATALTSMVLTKEKLHSATNKALLQYIIKSKDEYGTWCTTQSTVLSLKAINDANANNNIANQKITVVINNDKKEVEIGDNPLDLYEVIFDKINEENKISVNVPKGNIYYEITEEYYADYSALDKEEYSLEVSQTVTNIASVNDIIVQEIAVKNTSGDEIRNGLVQISIPQGCSVKEETLSALKLKGLIEKYDYNYNTINLYIRNFRDRANLNLKIEYRANYPEQITGGMVRVYDYYNPSSEGFAKPINILINN